MSSKAIVKYGQYKPYHTPEAFRNYLIEVGRKRVLARKVKESRKRLKAARQQLIDRVSRARILAEGNLLYALARLVEAKKEAANPEPSFLMLGFSGSLYGAILATRMIAERDIKAIKDLLSQVFTLREQEAALKDNAPALSPDAKTVFRRAIADLHPDSASIAQVDVDLINELVASKEAGNEIRVKGIGALTQEGSEGVEALQSYLRELQQEERSINDHMRVLPFSGAKECVQEREAAKSQLQENTGSTDNLLNVLGQEIKDPAVIQQIRQWLLITIE